MPSYSVGRDQADLARRQVVGRVEGEADEVVEVVLGGVVRRPEVGDRGVDALEHQRSREVVVRDLLGHRRPGEVALREAVEVADEQGAVRVTGHRVRTGVAVAGPGVEVEQEQVVDQRGAEALDRRAVLVVVDRRDAGQQLGDDRVVVGRRRARVPGLPGAVAAAIGLRGPLPEVEHDGGVGRVVRPRIDHREDLPAQQVEVGDRPQVAGVDLASRAPGPPPDLLGRHRRVDAPHHLRVAQERLRAGDHDVRRHGDQRALERGALLRERLRDRRVVVDQPVGGPTADAGSSQARTTASAPEQSSSTSAPAAGSSPAKAQAITQGTWNSRLTIPMWLRTVPLVQMIAVSSW